MTPIRITPEQAEKPATGMETRRTDDYRGPMCACGEPAIGALCHTCWQDKRDADLHDIQRRWTVSGAP